MFAFSISSITWSCVRIPIFSIVGLTIQIIFLVLVVIPFSGNSNSVSCQRIGVKESISASDRLKIALLEPKG